MMRSYALFRSNQYDEGSAIPSCRVRKLARYDALIVGTRCAGAPLAMLLARKGHNVLGVDRAISERHRFNSFHVAENDSISRKVGIVGQAFPLTTG
jgi:RAB protein geranylgeranyltransferase component A